MKVVKKIEMSKHTKLEVEESEYTVSELTKTSPKVHVHGVVTLVLPMKEGKGTNFFFDGDGKSSLQVYGYKFVVSLP